MNTMSVEYIFDLDVNQAETMFLNLVTDLIIEGEEESEAETIANRIMDNAKLYPEYFPFLE